MEPNEHALILNYVHYYKPAFAARLAVHNRPNYDEQLSNFVVAACV